MLSLPSLGVRFLQHSSSSAPNEADILEELQYKSFNQAIIDTTVSTDYIVLQNETDRRIKDFLANPSYQKNASTKHYEHLMKELADIYYETLLKKKDIEAADNKTTYLFLTEYIMKYPTRSGYIGGAGWAVPLPPCNGSGCKTIFQGGNFAIVFETNRAAVHNLVHELGHSFSLPHTFLDGAAPKYSGVHYFYMGYTDNIMDYGGRNKTTTTNRHNMNATFKWQWNILRNDNTITSPID